MKKAACFALMCLLGSYILSCKVWGQAQPDSESVMTSLNWAHRDTQLVNQLNQLSKAINQANPDSALACADLAVMLSDSLRYFAGKAEALRRRGLALRRLGQTDAALTAYEQALAIQKMNADPLGIARVLLNKGQLLRKQGQIEAAIQHYRQGIEQLKGLPPSTAYINLLNSMGVALKNLRKYDQAADYYRQAKSVANSMAQHSLEANANLNLGTLAAMQSDWQTAKARYQESLRLYQNVQNQSKISLLYRNLGNVYLSEGDLNEAKQQYDLSLDIGKSFKNPLALASQCNSYGALFFAQAEFDQALRYFHQGLRQIDSVQDMELYGELRLNLAKTYEELGKSDKAMTHLQSYVLLQEAMEEEKEKGRTMAQELAQSQHQQEVARMQSLGLLLGLVALGIIGLVGILSLWYRYKASQSKQRLAKTLNEQEHIQLGAMLRGQEKAQSQFARELHDNIGMLLSAVNLQFSGIEAKLDQQEDAFQQARSTLTKAVKEVRSLSHDMLSGTMKHLGLVEAVKDLVGIIEQDGLQIRFDHQGLEHPALPHSVSHSLYRIMQELLSNTVRHAQATAVDIQLILHQDRLNLMYEDNGKGFDLSRQVDSKGVGLRNIKARVQDIGGELHFSSQPGQGSSVSISIHITDPRNSWMHEED
ncbi:MAG: tetratricopeptide repeat protein [Bacteroidota bacterium]